MKKILTTITFVLIFVFLHSTFAVSKKTQLEQQKSEQKMAQLKQLLVRAAESNVKPETNEPTANMGNVADAQLSAVTTTANAPVAPSSISAPSAGVVSGSSAMSQVSDVANNAANGKETKTDIYREAFSNVINQMLPMNPAQIAKLREVFTESQMAAATPPGIPPKPTSSSLLVNLSAQAVPPVIRLGAGYITSLVFMDATGQPWPVSVYSIGDPSAFNIQWDRKGNTLLIQAATFYKRSNLAVILRDLNTPIMISLVPGQEAVDYRVDLRVPRIGPNAIFAQSGIPEAANTVLLDVLNAIPPKGSRELRVRGGDCQAWILNKRLYLRTSLNVISPGWKSIMSSIDGTHAYELQPSPVILALQNGRDKIITLTLDGLG